MSLESSPAFLSNEGRGTWLAALLGLSFLLLIAATWPLWQPATDFPQVPLVSIGAVIPAWLEWLALGSSIAAAIGIIAFSAMPARRTWSIAIWFLATLLLVVADQQRLQAWLWHGWLLGGILVGAQRADVVPAVRWLTAGLYFHSALSKLDATFVATLGREFFLAPLQGLGWSVGDFPSEVLVAGALAFPIFELIVAAMILLPERWRMARWIAFGGVMVMHAALLLILWLGLGHSRGVLLWNLFFLAQGVILFWPLAEEVSDVEASDPPVEIDDGFRWQNVLLYASLFLGIGLPCLAPWGLCDPWPAWELYAPRVARTELQVTSDAIDELPADLRELMRESRRDDALWQRVPLDRWSLAARGAPIYPHPRVQLGLALALAEQSHSPQSFRVILLGPADRWTGKRGAEELNGVDAIRMTASRYSLNSRPK